MLLVGSLLFEKVGQKLKIAFERVSEEIVDVFAACVGQREVVEQMGSPKHGLVENARPVQNQFNEENSLCERNGVLGEVVADCAHPSGQGVGESFVEVVHDSEHVYHAGVSVYDVLLYFGGSVGVVVWCVLKCWDLSALLILILLFYDCHLSLRYHLLLNNV